MKASLAIIFLGFLAMGCQQFPLYNPEQFRSYVDTTVSSVPTPPRYFSETAESKSVIMGSKRVAELAGCNMMQRYKIRTNVDFTASLNLYKYRAALMGAGRIAIINHQEVDAGESKIVVNDDDKIFLYAGTSLQGANYHTTIIGDLYDCNIKN